MPLEELAYAKILLIDDDEDNLALIERSLHRVGARQTRMVTQPFDAAEAYRDFRPDVVLLDLRLPPVDAFYIMDRLREVCDADRLAPIIVFTGDASPESKKRALEAGVADFLQKDFDVTELILRVRNVVRTQQLYQQVQRQKTWLEETVRVRTRQLQSARREVLERLALAAEFRDDETGEHTRRVGHLSAQIAQEMGQEPGFVEAIGTSALLHDLGKIGISDVLLLKQGPLTLEERVQMQEHTQIGGAILSDCSEPVMRMAREIALTHHERWDGGGYPNGLVGDRIPLCGRIVSVADAFDAMISERPYKRARHRSEAIAEIVQCSGKQFDPAVVAAFLLVMHAGEDMKEYSAEEVLEPSPELSLES